MATRPYPNLSTSPSPVSSSPSSSKLALQLRHDLAKLTDKDPDTRRRSMEALKSFIQGQLDAKTMLSFLDQVSTGGGGGGGGGGGAGAGGNSSSSNGGSSSNSSNVYAISLFVEVARVHTGAVIPFIPRIMSTVIRCLSCPSGNSSSNNLHDACSRVVSALARYAIGPRPNSTNINSTSLSSSSPSPSSSSPSSSSPSSSSSSCSSSNVLHALCQPLLGSLTSNIEHVSVGSAICLQSLIEAENWKHAGAAIVAEVCHVVSICFLEKGKKTPAHIRLVAALSKFNANGLQGYGSSLLKLASDIILTSPSGSGSGSGSGFGLGLSSPSGLSSVSWHHRVAAAHLIGTILCCFDPHGLNSEVLLIATNALESCRCDKAPMVRQAVTKAISLYKDKDLGCNSKVSPISHGIAESEVSPDPRKRGARRKRLWKVEESCHSSSNSNSLCDDIVANSKESKEMHHGTKSMTIEKTPSFGSPLPPSPASCSSVKLGRSPLYPAKQSPVTPSMDRYMVESELDFLLAHIKSPDSKENAPLAREPLPLPLLKSDELGYIHFNSGSKISKDIGGDNVQQIDHSVESFVSEEQEKEVSREEEKYDVVDADPCREFYVKCDSSNGPFCKQEDEKEDSERELCGRESCIVEDGDHKLLEIESDEAKKDSLSIACHNACVNLNLDEDHKPPEEHRSLTNQDHKPLLENPKTPDQVTKNDTSIKDFLTFSTPRRLVRPLPQSGSSPLHSTDKKLCGLDTDFETISESGWSVRDNPIAGDSSDADSSPRITWMHTLSHKKEDPPLVRHSFAQGSILTNNVDGDYIGKSSRVAASTGHFGSQFPAYERPHDDGDDDYVAGHLNPAEDVNMKGHIDHVCGHRDVTLPRVGSHVASLLQQSLRKLAVYGQRLGKVVEVLLLGALLAVLVFATLITILNCVNRQNESHLLVPT